MLTHPLSAAFPSLQDGDSTRDALLQMAQILKRVDSFPEIVDCYVPPRVQKESISKNNASKANFIPNDEHASEDSKACDTDG